MTRKETLKIKDIGSPWWYKRGVQVVLPMSRPFKHPKTGVFYFRKVVPDDLREVVGKREVKVSLKTKSPAEAKAAYVAMAAEVAARWKALRAQPEPLTQRQIVALAGLAYRELVHLVEDEPGEPEIWRHVLRLHAEAKTAGKLEAWVGPSVDDILQRQGIRAEHHSRARLIAEVDKALVQAAEHLHRAAEGDYRPDPNAARFPDWTPPKSPSASTASNGGARSLKGLVEDWWREAKATGTKVATYESYRNTMGRFVAFLGHDDLNRVTTANVVAFKDHRLQEVNPRTGKTISAKTVKDSDLSGLKAVFSWAVSNQRIASNPATGVTVKLRKRVKLRSSGYTDEEASVLLSAAWYLERGGERPKTHAAKRWAPWLCAFSGARLGEIVQLRKEDVRQEGGHWGIFITPEAGVVKDNEARFVVLHSQLLELGFLDFVRASGPGYLFLTVASPEDFRGKWRALKNRVTEFVRTVITDPNVRPNHAWRHRLKTVGMEVGISHRILDAIEGHEPRSVGEDYGDVSVKAQAAAMAKFPYYEITRPSRTRDAP